MPILKQLCDYEYLRRKIVEVIANRDELTEKLSWWPYSALRFTLQLATNGKIQEI